MIKKISLYSIAFILFSGILYIVHTVGLSHIADQSPISLKNIYIFNTGFSILLCIAFILLSENQKFSDQLGFLYLGSVVLKIIGFCLVFYKPIFKTDSYTNIESVNLLIPIMLFLFLEVFFISKILKNIHPLKNDK